MERFRRLPQHAPRQCLVGAANTKSSGMYPPLTSSQNPPPCFDYSSYFSGLSRTGPAISSTGLGCPSSFKVFMECSPPTPRPSTQEGHQDLQHVQNLHSTTKKKDHGCEATQRHTHTHHVRMLLAVATRGTLRAARRSACAEKQMGKPATRQHGTQRPSLEYPTLRSSNSENRKHARNC